MEIGFSKDNNLFESNLDDRVWRNLVDDSDSIVSTIRLFSNNTKATAVLSFNDYEIINGDTINVINGSKVGFSNRTRVSVNNKTYRVENSNGQTQFQLVSLSDGSAFVPDPTNDNIIRSNTVTFENLQNMDVERFETNVVDFDTDDQTSLINSRTISENLSNINSTLSSFYLVRERVPFTIGENRFNNQIVFDGSLRIPPQENFDISDPASPGIFILSPDGQSNRAFSDTSNPWTEIESTSTLKTDAQNVTVNDVRLSKGDNFEITGIVTESVSPSSVVDQFTHKLRVTIDGEEYALLLRAST